MAVKESGISTLGVKLGYKVDTAIPTTDVVWLERCNSIGGISLESEKIDSSALEDEISKFVNGRQDNGGSWSITFNITDEVVAQLEAMITAFKGKGAGEQMYMEVWSPYLTKAFWVVVEPPLHLPMPEISQNGLQTIELSFAISDYKGMNTAVEPKATV